VSTETLREAISAIAEKHPAWGVLKVWATLRRKPFEIRAGRQRIWVLMRDMGLLLSANRRSRTPAPRLHVTVEEPNRRWATDLTTVWTEQDGLVAVVPVIDCGDRVCLALEVTKSQETPAILAPVRRAMAENFEGPWAVPADLELRTDHGPQYTSVLCEQVCGWWRLDHTFAPIGQPTGNSVAERFIRTIKEECVWLRDWRSAAELQAALDAFRLAYNEHRPHQSLGWQTPAERRAERLHGPRLAA
jgi:putative transposase